MRSPQGRTAMIETGFVFLVAVSKLLGAFEMARLTKLAVTSVHKTLSGLNRRSGRDGLG